MRRDFTIRFTDFGGIRAIVVAEAETVAFPADPDGPLPPVRHIVVGDDSRDGQRTVMRETFPGGRPPLERNLHYIDERRARTFASELATARGSGSWLTFDGLAVVHFVLELFAKQVLPAPPGHEDATTATLWQAVIAAPDDDGPRLVLADHLLAHGDPRGELITAQCSLAKRFDLELWNRADKLARAAAPHFAGAGVSMQRGFVEAVSIGTLDSVRNHGRVDSVQDVLAILRDRELQTARRIVIEDVTFAPDDLRALLLPNLRYLRVTNGGLGDAGAAILSDAALERLELPRNAITTLPRVTPTVRWLDLSSNDITRLPDHLASVECLWLTGNPAAPALLARMRAPKLGLVDIARCGISELVDTPILGQLRCLILDGNPLRDLSALVAQPRPNLQTLHVQHCRLTDDAIRALCDQRARLPALDKIVLDGNPLTRDARAALRDAFGERIQLY